MNLTPVGPLSPSVYWRRRALVLGGLALLIILIVYSCSDSGAKGTAGTHTPSPSPSTAQIPVDNPSIIGSPAPVGSLLTPPSPQPSGQSPAPSATTSSTLPSAAPPGSQGTCTDTDIRVTTGIASTSATSTKLAYGGTFNLRLTITNISSTTCTRDVGGEPEELSVVDHTGKVVWSSDDCVKDQGKVHDVRTFAPGIGISATVQWNSNVTIAGGCKVGSPAPAATYTLVGRDGTATGSLSFTIAK